MTIQLAAVCFLSIAIVSTAGWIYTFRALRRSRGESAALSNELADLRETNKKSEDELAVVKRELANTQGTLKRFRDFINFLEPLFLQLARDAGDGRALNSGEKQRLISWLS